MTLNKQLIAVSLLLLCLPWAGCQYLQEMDQALRQGQATNLEASSRVIAQALALNPQALHPHGIPNNKDSHSLAFYCHPLPAPIWADGYDEEWQSIAWSQYLSSDDSPPVRYRCGISGDTLSLVFAITDHDVVYNNPIKSLADNGDRLLLKTGTGREYIFTAVAPGDITARYFSNTGSTYRESRIDAAWVDNSNGYQLEISIPLSLVEGKLSFHVIDEGQQHIKRYGPALDTEQPPWFIYQAPNAIAALKDFSQPGIKLSLTTPDGWLFASAGSTNQHQPSQEHWLISKLYRALLSKQRYPSGSGPNQVNFSQRTEHTAARQGLASSTWYQDPQKSDHYLLATAIPIMSDDKTVAVLIAEQSSEQTAALTDQALSRLFLLSFTVFSLAVLALLAYANWLSWRIRRLHRATQQALDNPNELTDQLPASRANDEIDQLTLSYSALMARIQEYTDYLQTLARKLSHELRTPLAIIHSSLDNLSNQKLDQQSQVYQQRAKDGALRLGNLITAMSEARRVEESIEQAELEKTNIAELLLNITEAYRDSYPDSRIHLNGINATNLQDHAYCLDVAPELLVQMLDKLIDNACSFTPQEGDITINFKATEPAITIAISNDGPLLPDTMQSQLFDNLVSIRGSNNSEHLGMGLHIVQLIMAFHGGTVKARNRDDGSGVIFNLTLPRQQH